MIGRSVDHVPQHFLHLVRKRWPCDECGRQTLLDEIELWVATVHDRGRAIVRACRQCHGRRARWEWLERRSVARLRSRILRQGYGSGAELVQTRRRLGLEPLRSVHGGGTR